MHVQTMFPSMHTFNKGLVNTTTCIYLWYSLFSLNKSRRTWLVSLYRKAKRLAPNLILVSENLLNIQSKLAVHCLVNKCSRGILSLLESLHPYRTDTLRFVLATLEFEFSSTTNIYMYSA